MDMKTIPSLDDIKARLEELFSKKCLADDAFLQKHMNAQMFIPVTLIAKHERMKSFCTDSAAIIAAAKQSTNLGVDDEEQMVRPVIKPSRNTLILRDLPADVTEDELTQFFKASPESEALASVKPDVNRTAFVAFASDEAAQNAALWLRSQKLRGEEIKCAMKTEHFVRSFFPAAPSAPMSPYVMPGTPVMMWQPMYNQWSQGAPYDASSGYEAGAGAAANSMEGGFDGASYDGAYDGRGPAPDDMLSHLETNSMFGDDGMGGIPAGYQHEFRKYSRKYIVEVCNGMADLIKPEAYEELATCEDAMSLFREEPCKEWAPLPSMEPLFPTDEKRRSEDQSGDLKSSGRSQDRSSSWSRTASGRRQPREKSRDLETYHEEADWAKDPSWDREKWRQKNWSSGDQWSREKDHSAERKWSKGSQWVEKGKSRDGEEKPEAGQTREKTWAEKMRSADGSAAQKQVAEKKAEKDEGAEKATTVDKTRADGAGAAEGAKPAEVKPDQKPEGGEKKQGMSWADKVKRSAT